MNKKKVLSLGLVAANIASMPVSAVISDDANLIKNNEVIIETNSDDEDNSTEQWYDYKSTTLSVVSTPPAVTVPPLEKNDEYFELINTIEEERIVNTTGGQITVSITVKAPSVVYGNPVVRSELSGKVIDKNTNEEIKGQFSWVDGYENQSETKKHQWKFTPNSEKFNTEITGEITVNVRKHDFKAYNVNCTELYFGDQLIESKLKGVFRDEFGQKVEGNLIWDSPYQTVIETAGQFHWTFVPDDLEKNNVVKGSLIVNAKQGNVVTPVVKEVSSENIKKLDEFKPVTGTMVDPITNEEVKGSFRIVNEAPKTYNKPETEDVIIEWEFTPQNTKRYKTVYGTVTVKAYLRYLKLSSPSTSSIGIGSSLYESVINGKATDASTNKEVSGVWRWEKPWISINQSGSYSVNFIPDIDNVYNLAGGNAYVNVLSSNKQKEVEAKVLDTEVISVGQRLGDSIIYGTAIDKKTGNVVKGKFTWLNPSERPEKQGPYIADFLFIPNNLEEYKPVLGEATVTVSNEDIKIKLKDVSATSVKVGDMITNSKISGEAEIDGTKIEGTFEWLDKNFKFTEEGLYYETVKFEPWEDKYNDVYYISVPIKVYNQNQVQIQDVNLSSKNSLDVTVDKAMTLEEAENILAIDGYNIDKIELLAPSNSRDGAAAVSVEIIDNGYTSSDKIRLITKEELKGQVRVTVEKNPDGIELDKNLKPEITIDADRQDYIDKEDGGSENTSNSNNSGNGSDGSESMGNTGDNSGSDSSENWTYVNIVDTFFSFFKQIL